MISKLGPTLAGTTLAAALVAAGVVWLPGASADQPVPTRRDYVSDTFGNATRTTVTGQCVRTTLPDAGMQFRRCDDGEVETAAAPTPAAPAAAREPEMAAAPKAVEQAPVPAPAPAPAAPVAQEQPVTTPAASADEEVAAAQAQEEASADARYDEEVAATEQAMEPEAETAAAPAAPPEPPAEAAEAPPPAAPPAPPETSLAPPAPPAPPQPRKLRLAADTQFHFDRAELTPSGQAELDRLIGEMGAAQIGAISIVGYTDRIGTDAYNMKLSQRRADTVKHYLVGRSVEANRVQALGRGKNDPITTPATCKGKRGQGLIKCLAPDRRVEVEVVGLVTPPAQ